MLHVCYARKRLEEKDELWVYNIGFIMTLHNRTDRMKRLN